MSANTLSASTSTGMYVTSNIAKLYQVYSQGFSDSTEVVELRSDLAQIPQSTESVVIAMPKNQKLAMLKTLWSSIKPKVILQLEPGEIRRINDKLIVEKASNERILLYEVID